MFYRKCYTCKRFQEHNVHPIHIFTQETPLPPPLMYIFPFYLSPHGSDGVLCQFFFWFTLKYFNPSESGLLITERKKWDHLDNPSRAHTYTYTHTSSWFLSHQWFKYWCFLTGTRRYLIVELKISNIPPYSSCTRYKCEYQCFLHRYIQYNYIHAKIVMKD